MPAHERVVGGVRCGEVLSLLSDYLDDSLSYATRLQIEEHLLGCDWCEKFGGEFGRTVELLRKSVIRDEPLPDDVNARLRAVLDSRRN